MKSCRKTSWYDFSFISLMSAPAAKAFSLPVSTRQPMPGSASNASSACAVIDIKACLEVAELTAGLDMIAQGRAAIVDRAKQHLPDRGIEADGAIALHGVRRTAWRDAGQVERFAGIDVSDTDQGFL